MYSFDVNLSPQRRSFRTGQQVYSIVLEEAWWQALESVCPGSDALRGWIFEWVEDARAKGVNRQALIRYRIHQLMLEGVQEERSTELPALARLIGQPEAREHLCPFRDVATDHCKGGRCRHWQKDEQLRGFGRCRRLAQRLDCPT